MEDNANSNKTKRSRASWKPISVVKTFLEACLHELASDGREGSGLKVLSWIRVAKVLKDNHNFEVDQKQMKNHHDYLKTKYTTWLSLRNKTGNIYDVSTNTFNLSEEEWNLGPSSTEPRRVLEAHVVEDDEETKVVTVDSPTPPCSSRAPRPSVKTKKRGRQLMDEVKVEILVRMTKVIKGEFEKIKDIKVEDVSLTCDTQLEVFNNEVNRLSRMDDDLFTYEVKVANIPCDSKMDDDSEHEADDDMGYDPSDVAFIEWLGSKIFKYKTMDHYTMKALWIYRIRGDDEVKHTDEESDDEDEIDEVFRIETNIFDYKIPLYSAFNEFNYLLKVDPDLLTKDIMRFKTYEDYKDDWIYE
ncbi:VIER F-box protein 2 [Tanacetum coccineum]